MWREISKKGGKVLIYRGISNRKLMQTYRKILNISAGLIYDFGTFFGLKFIVPNEIFNVKSPP